MDDERKAGSAGTCDAQCPFCAAWSVYKNSEVAARVRGVERESLLLLRSVLEAGLRCMDSQINAAPKTPPTQPPREDLKP